MSTNNKPDVDALLRNALRSTEEPAESLVHKIKNDINKEKRNMTKRKTIKFSVVLAAALIATLSLSVVAFGEPVWRQLQTRILEGGDYVQEFFVKESDDGVLMGGIKLDENFDGRLVIEVEGEAQVWQDPLIITNLDEALALFPTDVPPMLPTYLPEGFAFESARFTVCPVTNPDVEWAGSQLILTYADGGQTFDIEIRKHPYWGGFDIWGAVEEITINEWNAVMGSGGLSVQASDDVRHTFSNWPTRNSPGSDIGYDVMVRMAESLR